MRMHKMSFSALLFGQILRHGPLHRFALAVFLLVLPFRATAQQQGSHGAYLHRGFDAACDFRESLQSGHGLELGGLLNAQSQSLLSSPYNSGKNRSSAYYWLQADKTLWPGASFIVEIEGGWGEGLDRLVETYSVLNGNAGEPSTLYIPKAYLTQSLLDERLTIYAGKLDLSSWYDLNDVANSSDIQFLSSSLVYNLAIPFPAKGLGMMAAFSPSDAWYIQSGFSDAQAVSTHTGFDTAFADDARMFAIAEAGWCPVIRERRGHYRFMIWYNQLEYPRFDEQGDEAGSPGGAFSFDQGIHDVVTLFCRYGNADPDVYTIEHFWSCGAHSPNVCLCVPTTCLDWRWLNPS